MTLSPIQRFIEDLGIAFFSGDTEVERKTIEAGNVARLQTLYAFVADGDLNSFVDELHPEIEYENVGPEDIPFVNEAYGPEEVGDALAHNFSLLEDQKPVVNSVIAQGDSVVVFASEEGRFRETGSEYQLQWVQQFTFLDRKLIKFRQVLDSATLMKAAGVYA